MANNDNNSVDCTVEDKPMFLTERCIRRKEKRGKIVGTKYDRRRKHESDKYEAVKILYNAGWGKKRIAAVLDLPVTTVWYHMEQRQVKHPTIKYDRQYWSRVNKDKVEYRKSLEAEGLI